MYYLSVRFSCCGSSVYVTVSMIPLVINIGVHDILLRLIYELLDSVLFFFNNFSARNNVFVRVRVFAKFMIENVMRDVTLKYSGRLTSDTEMIACIVVQDCQGQVFRTMSMKLSTCYFECGLSSFSIVCGCLVDVQFSLIPRICAISAITVEVNSVPFSVIVVVGKTD